MADTVITLCALVFSVLACFALVLLILELRSSARGEEHASDMLSDEVFPVRSVADAFEKEISFPEYASTPDEIIAGILRDEERRERFRD